MAGRARTKMATPKKTRKTTKVVVAREVVQTVVPIPPPLTRNKLFSKQVLIGLAVVLFILLAANKKHWFVPAVVNGLPVISPEVIVRLYSDYRLPAVNEIIDERVIMAEARSKNAVPTNEEVQLRVTELETQVGGPDNLNNLLSQEGTSRGSLERRLKLRLALEKIYSSEATVSAQEVNDFVASNKSQLTATDSASQRTEAEGIIRQNKMGQIINQKFAELREKANIKIF